MVFEDLQEVVCQLEIVWVLEATSSVLNGSVEEFPRQMTLNIAHVESGFEEGRIMSSTCSLEKVVAARKYSMDFMIVETRQYHAS